MTRSLWRAIARVLAHPRVSSWIIRQVEELPTSHLGGYMLRYILVPYEWRWPFAIRIHRILREDLDPYLHDHPFDWRTIVIQGWYVEEDIFGVRHLRSAGHTAAQPAEAWHRIDQVSPGGVWTIFITGPKENRRGEKRNRWGFLTGLPARKTHYREYRSENGRGA